MYGNQGFPKLGVLSAGPRNKEHNICGSILGSPCLWKPPPKSVLVPVKASLIARNPVFQIAGNCLAMLSPTRLCMELWNAGSSLKSTNLMHMSLC